MEGRKEGRRAIDFMILFFMLHDRIYTRPSLFYITIIEKIKVVFSFGDSDDLIKSISEYNIILFMYVSMITDKYFIEFTFNFARLFNSFQSFLGLLDVVYFFYSGNKNL